MTPIKTWTQEEVTIDFNPEVYEQLRSKYENLSEFLEVLKLFNADLSINKYLYNINPYSDGVKKGIHILGKFDSEFSLFQNQNLAMKCSQGKAFTENLRKQFYRTINLTQNLETNLNAEEKKLLRICPAYLHFQTHSSKSFFKQILFMERVTEGRNLGQTQTGFSTKFCQVFDIPSLEEISHKHQFSLHRYLDKNKHRQLLKIQTVYLFKRLLYKGIKICSLNQKNVLVDSVFETGQTRYTIIDVSEDLFPPLSPLYNALTVQLCT